MPFFKVPGTYQVKIAFFVSTLNTSNFRSKQTAHQAGTLFQDPVG